MNSKERCIAAINGRPVDRVPVFPLLMFFAQERYGITYREYATNGRALADSQLNIREKFPLSNFWPRSWSSSAWPNSKPEWP